MKIPLSRVAVIYKNIQKYTTLRYTTYIKEITATVDIATTTVLMHTLRRTPSQHDAKADQRTMQGTGEAIPNSDQTKWTVRKR